MSQNDKHIMTDKLGNKLTPIQEAAICLDTEMIRSNAAWRSLVRRLVDELRDAQNQSGINA